MSLLSYYSFSAEKFNVFVGIALNGLLLFLVKNYSSSYLGNYKYLLAAFGVYDIYLCTIHGLLNPVVIITKNTLGAALYAPCQSIELTSLYFACFTVPFSLMNIHFLYRYWSVAYPERVALFARPRFVLGISLYPISLGILWFFLAHVLRTDSGDARLIEIEAAFFAAHHDTIRDGWIVMDHWRDGKFQPFVFCDVLLTVIIIIGSFSVAATLAALTYRNIQRVATLSRKHRTIQYTLLAAVCIQTSVPLVCVYIPYFVSIMAPFLSITVFGLVKYFLLALSVFPGWDAVVIVFMIKDYRHGLATILHLRKGP